MKGFPGTIRKTSQTSLFHGCIYFLSAILVLISQLFIFLPAYSEPLPPALRKVIVSNGEYNDRVEIMWNQVEVSSYRVYRTTSAQSGFELLGETEDTQWVDRGVLPGVKYWYRVIPVTDDIASFPEDIFQQRERSPFLRGMRPGIIRKSPLPGQGNFFYHYTGYASVEKPEGRSIPELTKSCVDRFEYPADKLKRSIVEKHLSFLEPYYMNAVKLTFILNIALPYFDRGELTILSGFSSYLVNPSTRTLTYFSEDFTFIATFHSNRLFNVLKENSDPELQDIVLRNAELYCLYAGEREIIDPHGLTKTVHLYEAVAMSTRYLKTDRNWRSKTILVGTSKRDLIEKVKEAK